MSTKKDREIIKEINKILRMRMIYIEHSLCLNMNKGDLLLQK